MAQENPVTQLLLQLQSRGHWHLLPVFTRLPYANLVICKDRELLVPLPILEKHENKFWIAPWPTKENWGGPSGKPFETMTTLAPDATQLFYFWQKERDHTQSVAQLSMYRRWLGSPEPREETEWPELCLIPEPQMLLGVRATVVSGFQTTAWGQTEGIGGHVGPWQKALVAMSVPWTHRSARLLFVLRKEDSGNEETKIVKGYGVTAVFPIWSQILLHWLFSDKL